MKLQLQRQQDDSWQIPLPKIEGLPASSANEESFKGEELAEDILHKIRGIFEKETHPKESRDSSLPHK